MSGFSPRFAARRIRHLPRVGFNQRHCRWLATRAPNRIDDVFERSLRSQHCPSLPVPELPRPKFEEPRFVPCGQAILQTTDGGSVRGRERPGNVEIASHSGGSGHLHDVVARPREFSQCLMFGGLAGLANTLGRPGGSDGNRTGEYLFSASAQATDRMHRRSGSNKAAVMIYQAESHTIQPSGLPNYVARHRGIFGEINGRLHLGTENAQSQRTTPRCAHARRNRSRDRRIATLQEGEFRVRFGTYTRFES